MVMAALAIVELLNVIEDPRVGDIARFTGSLSENPLRDTANSRHIVALPDSPRCALMKAYFVRTPCKWC